MNDRYFYMVTLRGELTNLIYSPKYGIEKVTIASHDFHSDIEAIGEIHKILNEVLVTENLEAQYHFNKRYYPNNEKHDSKIETLFDQWKEYSPDEVINLMAYITVDLSNNESLEFDEDLLEFQIPELKNGLDIKIFVISPKDVILDLVSNEKQVKIH